MPRSNPIQINKQTVNHQYFADEISVNAQRNKKKPIPVQKLNREDFRMGSSEAANFPYVTEPVSEIFKKSIAILKSAENKDHGGKGILITGAVNSGKTRFAIESLLFALPDWHMLHLEPGDTVEQVPQQEVLKNLKITVFIDDLQQFVLRQEKDDEGRVINFDPNSQLLRQIIHTVKERASKTMFVVTCRQKDIETVAANDSINNLFHELEIIKIPFYNSDENDSQTKQVIEAFQEKGQIEKEDFDGTMGSLVLGLKKKQSEYFKVKDTLSGVVLRSMKFLSTIKIFKHTKARVLLVAGEVFHKVELLKEDKWNEVIDDLVKGEFLKREYNNETGVETLRILKDTYFEKMIIDYPIDEAQHAQNLVTFRDYCIGKKSATLLRALGLFYLDNENYGQARTTLLKILDFKAEDPDAYVLLGFVSYRQKHYDDSMKYLNKALAIDKAYKFAYVIRGNVFSQKGDYENALQDFNKLLELAPNEAESYYMRGDILGQKGDYENALQDFDRALILNPSHGYSLYKRGTVWNAKKDYDSALQDFNKAIDVDPEHACTYISRGIIEYQRKKVSSALQDFNKAIELDPQNTFAYITRAKFYYEKSEYKKAISDFNKVILLDPDKQEGYYGRARCSLMLGNLDIAFDDFSKIIAFSPKDDIAYYHRGSIYNRKGQNKNAIDDLTVSISLNPKHSCVYKERGNVWEKLQNIEKAKNDYHRVLRLDPKDEEAQRALRRLSSKRKKK